MGGPYDVAVVFTGGNDVKSTFFPFLLTGEDARLYEAVASVSQFAIALGINISTGKDSLSMKQKYQGEEVLSPGTVIISAAGHCDLVYC